MNYDDITKRLMKCENRVEAYMMLVQLNFGKDQLLDYAKHLDVHVNSNNAKEMIRAAIVGSTTGAVLNSKAIQGG